MDYTAIRRAADLPSIVMNSVRLRQRSSREWRGPCPLHNGTDPYNFAVYQTPAGEWKFKCFSACKRQGSAIDYVMLKEPAICHNEDAACVYLMGPNWRQAGEPSFDRSRIIALPLRPEPLSWRVIEPYMRMLDVPMDPSGKDQTTARAWWRDNGLDDATIAYFKLGFTPRCPTAYDPEHPNKAFAAVTIPIWEEDTSTLLNVRYRLINPPRNAKGKVGDKYRPHQKGLGLHLYDAHSITHRPDGKERGHKVAFIVEGEKKKQVLERFGLWREWGIISGTGGCGCWLREYGEKWLPLLDVCERVYVCFDPGAEEDAERTAMHFGRRGVPVYIPDKPDDMILHCPVGADAGLNEFMRYVDDARPVRSVRYWDMGGEWRFGIGKTRPIGVMAELGDSS